MEGNTHRRFKQILSKCIQQKDEIFLELFQQIFHLPTTTMYSTTEPYVCGKFRADVLCKSRDFNLFFEIKVTNPKIREEKRIFCENTNSGLVEINLSDDDKKMIWSRKSVMNYLRNRSYIRVNPYHQFRLQNGDQVDSYHVERILTTGLIVKLNMREKGEIYLVVSYQQFPDQTLSTYVSYLRKEEQKKIYSITIHPSESWIDHIKKHQMEPL